MAWRDDQTIHQYRSFVYLFCPRKPTYLTFSFSLCLSLLLLPGISVKTQELQLLKYVVFFICNCVLSWLVPLSQQLQSVYRFFAFFEFSSTAFIIFVIKYKEPFKSLSNHHQDSTPHWKYIMIPSALLATIPLLWKPMPDDAYTINNYLIGGSFWETKNFLFLQLFRWTSLFGQNLQAMAIFPQLVVLRNYRLVEDLISKYLLVLGLESILGIFTARRALQNVDVFGIRFPAFVARIVQALVCADFFYEYFRAHRLIRPWCPNREQEDPLVFELTSSSRDERIAGENNTTVQREHLLGTTTTD